jgi:hypothetical protein
VNRMAFGKVCPLVPIVDCLHVGVYASEIEAQADHVR